MRFRHASLEEKITKENPKEVEKALLMQSKAWKDHVAEHHQKGVRPRIMDVKTVEDSGLFKEVQRKTPVTQTEQPSPTEQKPEQKVEEEVKQPQQTLHTVDHGPFQQQGSRAIYVSGAGAGAQRNAGDEYFGVGSRRSQAISGQCTCGMEITTNVLPQTPDQLVADRKQSGYARPLETASATAQDQLYATATPPSLYSETSDSSFRPSGVQLGYVAEQSSSKKKQQR